MKSEDLKTLRSWKPSKEYQNINKYTNIFLQVKSIYIFLVLIQYI